MELSSSGIAFIGVQEGKRNNAYLDTAGNWTIGIGHTPARPGQVATDAEIAEYFRQDSAWAVAAVNAGLHDARGNVIRVTQHQFDAMVSLTFNIGGPAFRASTVLRLTRAGDYPRAAKAFELFDKEHRNGKLVPNPALLARRKREAALYLSATPPAAAPASPTAPAAELTADDLNRAELRRLRGE